MAEMNSSEGDKVFTGLQGGLPQSTFILSVEMGSKSQSNPLVRLLRH